MRLINQHPSRGTRWMLAAIPMILIVVVYLVNSHLRLVENPEDKLLPSVSQMWEALKLMAFTEDPSTGTFLMLDDTLSSLKRLGISLAMVASLGLTLGILLGSIPLLRASLSPLVAIISMVPPLAILPILFIVFGLDELSKIMLIVIGLTPMLARDLEQRARELPKEIIIKAQTLGANSWTLMIRVVLPQLLARLITSLRLLMGSAWLFLISAEAISSTEGLGYRIFLVRRYLAMDVILPYVLWITLLAWLTDYALKKLHQVCFPWAEGADA
ncbi:ABC transporter permease [Methylophilus sp. 3sh_L]|uniref:ABC transporter permease n=1 Tax=Methylophilus sp. 3sh_L TaxID=3377114 RepID=UPI00398F7422